MEENLINLLIIDDKNIKSEKIHNCLLEFNIKTYIANIADQLDEIISCNKFQLIIVNKDLPIDEYIQYMDNLYAMAQCPIIYIPQRDSTLNIILGFIADEKGYVLQPFLMDDLIIKIKTYMKELMACKMSVSNIAVFGPIEINTDSEEVFLKGEKIELSPKEYKLLKFLIDNKEKMLTAEQILNCVWGVAYGDVNMLRVTIRRLRMKLDPDGLYIQTVRGKGYKFSSLKHKALAN